MPLWAGRDAAGIWGGDAVSVGLMMLNSLVMALMIATGKISISLLPAFAIIYFKFPFRMGFFWMIFITLMLPVEMRILPTFAVVADLNLLNSYWGLSIPLIAMGVDGIISDYPDRLRKVLLERGLAIPEPTPAAR